MNLHKFTMDDVRIDESKNHIISDSILNGLRMYAAPWLGLEKSQPFCFYKIGPSSKVSGGIYGAIRQYPQIKTAWIYRIWVEESCRGQGLGTSLLAHLNNFAYQKNCAGIQLEAFDFQGIPFFKKHEFQARAIIPNALAGRNKFFMQKAPYSDFASLGSIPILLDESENQEIKKSIFDGVNFFNNPYFGEEKQQDFSLYVQESSESIIGGITGKVGRHYAWVNILWVDQAYRNQGIGALLWKKLESYLRKKDCPLILIGAFESSTKLFYEKLGYQLQGTVPKWIGGYDQHWLEKRLTG